MARVEKTFTIPAAPDDVCAAMRNPKLIEDDEKSREALSVEIKDVKKTDTEHHYDITTVTYYRTVTGTDKTRTEQNFVSVKWDLKARRSTWSWSGTNEFAKRVKIEGSYTVVPKGAASDIVLVADIDVSVPIVGKTISKRVADMFASEWPKYAEIVKRFAKP